MHRPPPSGRWSLVCLASAGLLLAACELGVSSRKEGASCARLDSAPEGNCDPGLLCVIVEGCRGTCAGTCRRSCSDSVPCPNHCTCTSRLSKDNGGGLACLGPGC